MRSRSRARPWRSTVLVAVLALAVVAACGTTSDDAPVATGSTAATAPVESSVPPSSASASSASTATTAPPTTGLLDRAWVGTEWSPSTGDGAGQVLVDGRATGLSSVAGLCQGDDCAFGLDLLTDRAVDGAPPAGTYLLWSSRLLGRDAAGGPLWQVADQVPVTLEPGESPILCSPVGDPTGTALGVAGTPPAGADTVVPDRVWTATADGTLDTPDPAAYTCEVGQD